MAYFDFTGTKGLSVRVHWSESYNVASNTSIVSITNIQFLQSKYYGEVYYLSGSVSINGETIATMDSTKGYHQIPWMSAANTWYDMLIEDATAFPWKSGNITHNTDGTGSTTISLSITAYSGSGGGGNGATVTGTQNITLTTIPRASSLSLSATSVNVEGTITATISRASTSFTHTVEFYINDTYYKKYTNVNTSQKFTIPASWYETMPSSTSCTAYCRVTTYNGSTKIGDRVRESFTVKVPSSIKPTIGTITLNPTDINGHNILVKGKNKLTVSVSGCSAGTGSSIKSYTFSGPSISATTTDTSVSATSVSATGTLTYTVTVTDTRGRTASGKETIVCYNYYAPSFTSFKAYRANADGTANVNGEYLGYTYATEYASVNNTNSTTVTLHYNNESQTITANMNPIALNIDTTYKVYMTVKDAYGGSKKSSTVTVFGSTRVFNVTQDGTGFAIGKMAEDTKLFECRWPAKINGQIKFGSDVQGRLYTSQTDAIDYIQLRVEQNNPTSGTTTGLGIRYDAVQPLGSSNSGLVNLGRSGRIWNQVYAANTTISTSDRNKKTDIREMSDAQEALFDELKPVTYKFINGTSDRTHYGFVSQDVEESMSKLGMQSTDFAGFCKDIQIDDDGNVVLDDDGNRVYDYALRYSEFIALNTYMIQKLQAEITDLKATIEELKSKL